jgi:hypothetical protein
LTLPTLEPVHETIASWAKEHSLPIQEGIIELGDALPCITVVGFKPEDIRLFLTLLEALKHPVLILNPHYFDEEGLRLVQGLAGRLQDPKDRRYYTGLIDTAKTHLGQLQHLTAYAFSSDLSRAVVFRAATDWAEPLFALVDRLDEG